MPDSIFLIGTDSHIEQVPYRAYVSEDVLQDLIAKYPELLAGEQIDPDDPPRWLLVKREAGVPNGETASDRWAMDHLLQYILRDVSPVGDLLNVAVSSYQENRVRH